MFKLRKWIILASFILFIAPISTINAHPHILIDAQIKFNLNQSKITQLSSLTYIWQFDENFSLILLGDYDDNKDQLLSVDELTTLAIETMEASKELGYFTHLVKNDTEINLKEITKIDAKFEDSRLTFEFTLELPEPVTIDDKLKFAIYDEEYYTAFNLAEKPSLQLVGDNVTGCSIIRTQQAEVDENIENALKNAFGLDTVNQGFGAKFAEFVGIKCI